MDATFTARFVHTGYHLETTDTDARSIDALLTSTFPRGSVIEVTIKARTTGESRGTCKVKTKWGTCGDVLDADGTCHRTDEFHVPTLDAALEEATA